MPNFKKGIVAIFSAWIFLASGLLLLGLFVSYVWRGNLALLILPPLILGTGGCFWLGWINGRSFKQALHGSLTAIIVGVPLAYFIIMPAMSIIFQAITPSTYDDLSSSAPFMSIWFHVSVVSILEVTTDNSLKEGSLFRLLIGVFIIVLFLVSVDVLTAFPLGLGIENSSINLLKLAVYAPIVWTGIVMAVNAPFRLPTNKQV